MDFVSWLLLTFLYLAICIGIAYLARKNIGLAMGNLTGLKAVGFFALCVIGIGTAHLSFIYLASLFGADPQMLGVPSIVAIAVLANAMFGWMARSRRNPK